jgi:hypothetical protein
MKRALFAAFAVLLTACAPIGVGTGVPAFASGLVRFDACEDYLSHVKTEAKRIVTPYGLQDGWYGPVWFGDDVMLMDAAGADGAFPTSANTGDSNRQAGVDYSTTNVQEAGVDEPDVVKTDGELIYAISNSTLYVVDVTGEPTIADKLWLENGWGEILLAGDRIIVLSSQYGGGVPDIGFPGRGIAAPTDDYYYSSPVSVLTEIGVSDPTDIAVVRTLYLDGGYLSARMSGDVARIVVRAHPTGFQWEYPEGGGLLAEIKAKNANRAIIDDSTLENWIPYYVLEEADGTTSDGLLIDCADAYRPQEFAGLGMLTVVTVDLSEGLEPDAVGVLAEGDTVYASTDSLYVASRQWVDWNELSEAEIDARVSGEYTEIHKFDISDPAATVYRASGKVNGFLLNQFSMSEHNDYLRVATTDQAPWWGRGDRASESYVTVLGENGGKLEVVGSVGGLGKGERIFSVRFMGDVGYVVTFRQTDPLYTIDLSDPTSPTVMGELKILGYSAYLHPLGDGLLLGVGQDATEEGWTLGTQVSIFDVSDLENPERIHQYTMKDGYSDVEFDHRAFLYWEATGTAVIPIQRWGWDERSGKDDYFVGAVGVELDRDRGIQELGSIVHASGPDNAWAGQIRRSVVIGDTVFTVSDLGLAGSDLATLTETSWLGF